MRRGFNHCLGPPPINNPRIDIDEQIGRQREASKLFKLGDLSQHRVQTHIARRRFHQPQQRIHTPQIIVIDTRNQINQTTPRIIIKTASNRPRPNVGLRFSTLIARDVALQDVRPDRQGGLRSPRHKEPQPDAGKSAPTFIRMELRAQRELTRRRGRWWT